MAKGPGLTHLLLGVCGLLALVNGAEWIYLKYGIEQSRNDVEQPVESNVVFEDVGMREFSLPPKENFAEIVERPVMIEGRRPVPEEELVPVVAQAVNKGPMKIKLMGIVMSPNGMTALLEDSKGKYHRVQIDGTVEGWELDEMHKDKVVLKQGNSSEELKLHKPKPKKPVPVGRQQLLQQQRQQQTRQPATAVQVPAIQQQAQKPRKGGSGPGPGNPVIPNQNGSK